MIRSIGLTLASLTALFCFVGCAGTPKAPQVVAPPPASAPDASPSHASWTERLNGEASTHDEATENAGVLVVSKEIVSVCPELQAVKRGVRGGAIEPDAVWFVVLESLANCMTEGPLRLRRVRVAGAAQGCDLVKQVLSSRGVPMDHVAFRDEQESQEPRIEITLVPVSPPTT